VTAVATDRSLVELVAQVAKDVAGPNAASVDAEARFPHEAFAALREIGAMSALVSVEEGGWGASLAEVGLATQELGKYCASTSMIFAMHQIQAACLVRHGRSPVFAELRRRLVEEQILLASATTELGIGGDVRTSSCAVERVGDRYRLEKNAPVISYAEHADAIFVTARATPDSPPSDQSLVVCLKEDLQLEPTSVWDTLGFRGTCSPGFVLRSEGPISHVLDDPYGDMSARTMLPVSHSLWGHVWLGIADAAVDTARRFVRKAARSKPGTTPPGASRLVEVVGVHQQLADVVHTAAARFDAVAHDDDVLTSVGFAIAMNNVKITASTLVIDIVSRALLVVGIAGYREDGAFAMGRLLRDAYGGALMVNNDRIAGNTAQLLLVHKD
jgi:acyl-CoA dehydrogenase